MPRQPVRKFVPQNNVNILNAIRKHASSDYQRRIPEATKANIQETMQNLVTSPAHRNEFVSALINRIGMEIIRSTSFENPLAKFKRPTMLYGDSIEEIQIGLAQSYVYDADREYLEKAIYGRETPDIQASLHKINRQEYYKISISDAMLRRAFTAEYGLSTMISEMMSVPNTSDQWDEFLVTCQLFREYEDAEGFFKVNTADLTSPSVTNEQIRAALKSFRAYSQRLPFVSTHYNAAGMPVSTTPDKLHLFITPEANAAIDVDALAGAFNIERADFPYKSTVIPAEYMNIPGAQAILTTEDFFVIADTLYETRQVQNPVGLFDNHFLHHHQIISASRFAPAILFTTDAGTVIEIQETEPTSITALSLLDEDLEAATELTRGSIHQVLGYANTTPVDGFNDGIRLELVGATTPETRITQTGSLAVSITETAEELTVNAYATDDNSVTATATFPVVGDIAQLWPNPQVIDDPSENGDGDGGGDGS